LASSSTLRSRSGASASASPGFDATSCCRLGSSCSAWGDHAQQAGTLCTQLDTHADAMATAMRLSLCCWPHLLL
jgi:hypothetical protein